jgi:hypothetical protein
MDAHQGVIAVVSLLLAIGAGVFALLSFTGEARDRKQADARRAAEDERYWRLLDEMLYEAVHNLRHLVENLDWEDPGAPDKEYDGCRLDGWPDLQFRYGEPLLEVPYVDTLDRDLPAVGGFLDHALRNASRIDRHGDSPGVLFLAADEQARVRHQLAVAQHHAWLTEHLLRVLVCARYRVEQMTPDPERAQRIQGLSGRVLTAAGLGCKLDPGTPAREVSVETELRDCVRLVRHERGVNERDRDTTVALFNPSGGKRELFDSSKKMSDPPKRHS